MAILALMVSQIAVPKGKKKLRWRNDHQVDHRVTDLRQNCRNQGPGGWGDQFTLPQQRGGIILTTLLPPSWTFRPSYGPVTANAMASGRMRCNGTLIFVAECYTTMEWNSFWWSIPICIWVEFETHFFHQLHAITPKCNNF